MAQNTLKDHWDSEVNKEFMRWYLGKLTDMARRGEHLPFTLGKMERMLNPNVIPWDRSSYYPWKRIFGPEAED